MTCEEFVPIYLGRDFYVPAFEVKLAGSDVPTETLRDIISVSYTDSIDQFDTFEITINNWDEERRDFKYTGPGSGVPDARGRDQMFDPGQEIELWMGYLNPTAGAARRTGETEPLRLMLAGLITKLAPSFPAAGQPTLKISGQNALIKMVTRQETHTSAANKKDSEIAEEVGRRRNLTLGDMRIELRTDSEAKGREVANPEAVLQANQYDILFLIERARRNGYDVVLQQETSGEQPRQYLYFGPSTTNLPVCYLLEWGKSLIDFSPTLTTARQVRELTVRGWDSGRGEAISVTVNRGQLPTRALRDEDRLYRIEQGFRERHEIVVDRPFRNRQEAERFALDRLGRLSGDMVTARGTTFGTPDLRAGRRIEIQRLGQTFDGHYFLKSTTHTMGASGYTTAFDARLEEEN